MNFLNLVLVFISIVFGFGQITARSISNDIEKDVFQDEQENSLDHSFEDNEKNKNEVNNFKDNNLQEINPAISILSTTGLFGLLSILSQVNFAF